MWRCLNHQGVLLLQEAPELDIGLFSPMALPQLFPRRRRSVCMEEIGLYIEGTQSLEAELTVEE